MFRVGFITVEYGDKDLIVSFALEDPDDYDNILSLNLIRTPIYEEYLFPQERGVSISLEGEPDEDEADCLTLFRMSDGVVALQSRHGKNIELDVSRVDADEMAEMKRVILKMNFDDSLQLELT